VQCRVTLGLLLISKDIISTEDVDPMDLLSLHQLAINGDPIILEQKLKGLEKRGLIEDKDLLKPALLKRDNNYQTPLHYAMMLKHAKASQVLVKFGPDLNPFDNLWNGPMHHAARWIHQPDVHELSNTEPTQRGMDQIKELFLSEECDTKLGTDPKI
jgi:ankyrin repeat protein